MTPSSSFWVDSKDAAVCELLARVDIASCCWLIVVLARDLSLGCVPLLALSITPYLSLAVSIILGRYVFQPTATQTRVRISMAPDVGPRLLACLQQY